MGNRLLQTLSDVLNDCENQFVDDRKMLPENSSIRSLKAQREWFGAIAAAESLLKYTIDCNSYDGETLQGLVFSSPVPVFSNLSVISHLQTGLFTPEAFQFKALMPCSQEDKNTQVLAKSPLWKLPLIPNDPIIQEQFCFIFTTTFALVMVLGKNQAGNPQFHFSFAPETIDKAWQTLRSRLVLVNYPELSQLDAMVANFSPNCPDYRLVSQFSRQLLHNLPNLTALAIENTREGLTPPSKGGAYMSRQIETVTPSESATEPVEYTQSLLHPNSQLEMELLQALTHEIRTPLTTIRTLTKLLLKKKQDFSAKVIQRLQAIDRECTEQIERMELIFRATELESTPVTKQPVHLTPCCLESLLQQTIPRWEKQAQRRNVNLDVSVPRHLPQVVSDPAMLDRALTGLMESCTRSISNGGQIQVNVSTAGDRLKLQVISQSDSSKNPFKALGQLLMFQPETGCLSLNWDVTKNMFQALGGKMTVRQKTQQGKELTIFLPLGKRINNHR
ncbi:sensor histidine kinase [Hyella patelloides]|uniref:sensor histidine kinase n=1 Tax=Hyella patelloides TaxID=1982969 RepID=UPI0011A42F47|nr:HAMP domain-containing sensor histidine kinase [Hyella patelloides]